MLYYSCMNIIIGLKLSNRIDVSSEFQKIITKYGCAIRTRLGLHQTSKDYCSSDGIILLEITDNENAQKLTNELLNIDNIEIQQMIFN